MPVGQLSEKANELVADCTCAAATGPNPGIDGGSATQDTPVPHAKTS